MLRLASGAGGRTLNHPQPVELVFAIHFAPGAISFDVTQEAGIFRAAHEIAVQGEDDVRIFKFVLRLDRLAKRHHRARPRVIAVHRLPHMPLGVGESFQQRAHLAGKGGRGKVSRQKSQACALPRILRRQRRRQHGLEICEAPGVTQFRYRLRAIRIVKLKN